MKIGLSKKSQDIETEKTQEARLKQLKESRTQIESTDTGTFSELKAKLQAIDNQIRDLESEIQTRKVEKEKAERKAEIQGICDEHVDRINEAAADYERCEQELQDLIRRMEQTDSLTKHEKHNYLACYQNAEVALRKAGVSEEEIKELLPAKSALVLRKARETEIAFTAPAKPTMRLDKMLDQIVRDSNDLKSFGAARRLIIILDRTGGLES